MIGDVKLKYCPICDENTDHQQGTFKCKEINGELFHFDASLSDSIQKVSAGFRDFVLKEHDGLMDGDSPSEYAGTKSGGLNFEELFASQVRSLKCSKCQHLIKISRFP
jgi:hypothetical protein